jgi:hypothetical protein
LAGPWLAETALRAGRYEEALRIAKAALVQAEASESGWFLCVAHITLGQLFNQLELRDEASAEAHLLAALHHAEGMESRPLCVHVLLALGKLLSGKRETLRSPQPGVRSQKRNGTTTERNRAREYLTRAADLGGMLGMHPVREQSLALLAQLEAPSPGRPKKKT